MEGSGSDAFGVRGEGAAAHVAFGGGDRVETGGDSLQKRPRDAAHEAAAAPRSHRPSATKLAEAGADAGVAEDCVRGGGAVNSGSGGGDASDDDDDEGNSDDIPDVVLESADEGD